MRLSVAVQARPERAPLAELIAEQAGGQVVWDPEPGSPVRSPWRTYRRCLDETPAWATHRLVLQDDVELCPGFRQAAEAAVAAHPGAAMCFFVQGIYPYQDRVFFACQRDVPVCDLRLDRWAPCVATCWPAAAVGPMLEFIDGESWGGRIHADDEVMGRAARAVGLPVYATVPSLVEHPDEIPSVGGKRRAMAGVDHTRVAACFIHPDCDATAIDWACEPSVREAWR